MSTCTSAVPIPRPFSHWIMKSEGESRIEDGVDMRFSIDDLLALPDQTTSWDGVRNFVASRHLQSMVPGDICIFYHSNCKDPGCVALVRVVSSPYVDHTAFDRTDVHFDPKSDPAKPKWKMVDVKFERMLKRPILLSELKSHFLQPNNELNHIALFKQSRLSVSPLTDAEFQFIMSLESVAQTASPSKKVSQANKRRKL